MLVRFGAATWLSIIILVWGVVATAFAGMWTTTQFYTLRLLLGIAEAGTFPGMWCGHDWIVHCSPKQLHEINECFKFQVPHEPILLRGGAGRGIQLCHLGDGAVAGIAQDQASLF